MKTLALIPARGGSKRLPNKNIKVLGSTPLISWTIRSALASESCIDVMVSTDDEQIAEISRQHGASVPWLRPHELASDTTTSVDVAIHAINKYERTHGDIDAILLLQPTSPFRSTQTINRALTLFSEHGGIRPVVSVKAAQAHPAWCFQINEGEMVPYLGWENIAIRSQDLQPAWALDGSIYLISPKTLRTGKSFIPSNALPLIVDKPHESIDIDTNDDFELCEMFVRKNSLLQ